MPYGLCLVVLDSQLYSLRHIALHLFRHGPMVPKTSPLTCASHIWPLDPPPIPPPPFLCVSWHLRKPISPHSLPTERPTLSSQLERLCPRQAHHDTSIRHRLQHQRHKCRSGPCHRRTGVKVLFIQKAAPAARCKDGEDEGTVVRLRDGGDYCHAFSYLIISKFLCAFLHSVEVKDAYLARGIRHGAHDGRAFRHPRLELRHGDAGTDGNDELALDGCRHAFFGKDLVRDIWLGAVRLAYVAQQELPYVCTLGYSCANDH